MARRARSVRHCSVCGKTGHDRRAHPRRNPDVANPADVGKLEEDLTWAKNALEWTEHGARNAPSDRIRQKNRAKLPSLRVEVQRLEKAIRSARAGAKVAAGRRGASSRRAAAAGQLSLFNPRRRSAPSNPDWYRDKWGRPHPVRGSPGYEDGFVGMSRADKKYLKSGSDQPRGGYTQEAPGRARRATAPKRRSTAKRDTSAGERLASAKSRTQKANERARRVALRGF